MILFLSPPRACRVKIVFLGYVVDLLALDFLSPISSWLPCHSVRLTL
jgi:hypothetical protein